MLKFAYMFATIVKRFTLILATAGLLVALFAISGAQSDTVSARTIVIPESDSTLSPAIASTSVDNDESPVVAVQFTDLIDFDGIDYEKYLYEGWERSLTVELIDAPPGGARQDITVHLATGSDSTVSESDYSYPSSVTIPRGRSSVEFTVRSIDDTQVEPRETLNIYASSVDYGGQSYEQSDPGVDLTIFNDDELGHPSIEVIGDRNQILGATVTLQVTLREVLAENLPARSFMIGFSRNWAQAIDLTEDLKHSNTTYVSVNAKDHPALGKVGWVEFYYTTVIFDQGYIYGGGPSRQWLRWQGLFNVIDPAELPIVTINSVGRTEPAEVITGNSLSEPPFSELRRPIPFNDLVTVREGDTVQLELELISVPEGSMADTMTVHLITKNITTSESDYRVPSIVTIPRGQSRVTFEVNALQDSLGEDDESLYIYARTVSFGGQSYRQLYSRPNLSIAVTIVDDEEQLPIALQYVNDQSVVFEGESALLEVVLPDLPEGGLVDTMTVRLATGNKTTASSSDYSYPSTVTIPRGESRATFVVRARQDSWRERDETLNIYVSQFDYRGENYERAGLGVDLTIANNSDVIPIVTIRPHHPAFDSVSEGGRNTLKLGVTNIPSPRGADRDITVYLKTRNITASDYDYTYQSVITIPRGQNFKWAYVRGVDDNLLENHEYFEIYVSSIDYGGQNYEQSDTGTRLELRSNDRVQESLKVLGGADQAKGTTVTVRLELNYPLPAGVPDNTVRLAFFLTGSTRAVDATVYGQQFVLGLSEWETYLTIPTEAFQDSTIVDIPFYLADDGLAAEPGLEIRIRSIVYPRGAVRVSRYPGSLITMNQSSRNLRSLSDTSTSPLAPLTSTSSLRQAQDTAVRRSDLSRVNEGDTVQLVAELTNAPEGGMAEDITVHLATENSSAVSRTDYSYPSSVTIPRGQSRVTFEVRALQDDLVEDDETLNIYVSSVDFNSQNYEQSDAGVDLTIVDAPLVVVPPVTATTISATLTRSALTLEEGQVATITVDLDGDLSSLVDGDTTVLTIEARPVEGVETGLIHGTSDIYLPAEQNDYELTPVTIDKQAGQATFEIRAVEDSDYDPLESVMLELVSHSDDIEVGSPNSLKLKIGDNDPRPFVSFTTTLTTGRYFDGTSNIKVWEGDKGTFRVVLDRKSNRSVEVYIYSDGGFRPFFDANGVDPIQTLDHALWRYISDQGFWTYNETVLQSDPLIIPAGELGLTFIADTTSFANDLYDYIEEDYFGTVLIYMKQSAYAYTDDVSGKAHFRVLQDEPTPELSFRSADDGDATITVREGESFEVGIDIDPELGRYHRVWNSLLPGISLASQLTATAVTGEVPDWELPDVEIVPGQSGFTVTVLVPVDGLSNGERTVVLDFEDALLSYTRSHLTVPPRIKNSLVVTILDAEPLTAQLNTSELTLQEGRAATVTVDLDGDLSSLIDGDTSVLTIEARPVEGVETGLIHGTSDIYLPAERNDYELTPVTIDKQAGQATFEIRAVDDSDYDPLESVMLELVSHSDDVEIVSPDSLKLKIENNDPRPFVSFSSTIGTQRLLGEYATTDIPGSSVPEGEQGDFRVVLDRKSNRDVEFFIGFSGRPHLFSNDNEELVLPSSYIWTHGYLTEQGYRPGNPLNEWSLLRIPAGELGTTFTVDTRSAENDLYDYYWDRTISFGHIYVDKDHYAYTDHIGAKHNFFIAQDEPAPKLLLKSSAADDDGDATVTVSEGESFDVWVEVSHQFGTSVLFNEPDMNLKARLIATAITGAIPNLDLPDVYIGAYQSGVTVTMRIPVGSFANGEGTVALGFGDVVQLRRGTGNLFEVSARVGNRLIVNVQGGSTSPAAPLSDLTAQLNTSELTLTRRAGGDDHG